MLPLVTQRTTVITGCNRGIGLELARQCAARGDRVVGLVREASPELTEVAARVESGIDVGEDACIAAIRERLADETVDLLINNAGILRLDDLDFDVIRAQLEINSLGPLRVTSALVDRLAAGAKVAIVTSRMGSIADNTSGGSYGYRMSKAAVNAAGKSLAHDLAPRKVSVAILHPGWVKTEMTGHSGKVTAQESAAGLLARIDALTPETTGTFWHMSGEVLPW